MTDIIATIRGSFLEEAVRSPLLLSDLASLERYVSESYTGRSLIELLQNADDAGARRFFVRSLGDHRFLVANDGRAFTPDDIVALCRSGASTKARHAGTIGYRGIGFKSVVNYANAVHLVSGETRLTFSRQLTQALLGSDDPVPLVRIPHEFRGSEFDREVDACISAGFSTTFIFESSGDALLDEVDAFDESCLLFLHHIQATVFERAGRTANHLAVRAPHASGATRVCISGAGSPEDWLVYSTTDLNRSEAIAYRLQDERVVRLPWSESVVHSFMPTQDRLRFPIRINGDFSTDPSRTRVVLDDETNAAVSHCAHVLGRQAVEILDAGEDRFKVLEALADVSADPLGGVRGKSVSDALFLSVSAHVQAHLECSAAEHGNSRTVVQPEWIGEDAFTAVCSSLGICGVGATLNRMVSHATNFLEAMGTPRLTERECLVAMADLVLPEDARAAVLGRLVQTTRFGMDEGMKQAITRAHLVSFDTGVSRIAEVDSLAMPSSTFLDKVRVMLADETDLSWFLGALGLTSAAAHQQAAVASRPEEPRTQVIFSRPNSTKKWRSVEQNVAAVFEGIEGVMCVDDISEQNLGYDIAVMYGDGSKLCVEVKSVGSLGDTIAVTNNEYSTAVQEGDQYCIAVAEQSHDSISVCLIMNPSRVLRFQKRVTRWEWICNEYSGQRIDSPLSE